MLAACIWALCSTKKTLLQNTFIMKKLKIIIGLGLLLILLATTPFTSCRKSYLTDYIPIIELKSNPSISDSGVEVTALVVNETNEAIIRYGFDWSSVKTNKRLGQYIRTSDRFTGKQFSHLIDYALPNGDSIRICAFVETQSQIILSSPMVFKSKGSLPPSIDNYFPASGSQGDTLYIEGSRFSAFDYYIGIIIGDILLNIGNTRAFIVESKYEGIKAIIPYISTHNESVFEISLKIYDHEIIVGNFKYIKYSQP